MGKPTKKTKKILYRLAIANEARGTDSSGIAIIYPDGRDWWCKGTLASHGLVKRFQPFNLLFKDRAQIVIGHTRAATTGAVTVDNAHPFLEGKKPDGVWYAHNGIINNFRALQAKLGTSYQVDSQILGYYLRDGDIDTLAQEVYGSYAIPYVELGAPLTLNLYRHWSPLAVAVDGEQLYFSSEVGTLNQALAASGLPRRAFEIAQNRLYSYEWHDGIGSSKRDIVQPYYPYSRQGVGGYYSNSDYYGYYQPGGAGYLPYKIRGRQRGYYYD